MPLLSIPAQQTTNVFVASCTQCTTSEWCILQLSAVRNSVFFQVKKRLKSRPNPNPKTTDAMGKVCVAFYLWFLHSSPGDVQTNVDRNVCDKAT